jgi:hypothetical protein
MDATTPILRRARTGLKAHQKKEICIYYMANPGKTQQQLASLFSQKFHESISRSNIEELLAIEEDREIYEEEEKEEFEKDIQISDEKAYESVCSLILYLEQYNKNEPGELAALRKIKHRLENTMRNAAKQTRIDNYFLIRNT